MDNAFQSHKASTNATEDGTNTNSLAFNSFDVRCYDACQRLAFGQRRNSRRPTKVKVAQCYSARKR